MGWMRASADLPKSLISLICLLNMFFARLDIAVQESFRYSTRAPSPQVGAERQIPSPESREARQPAVPFAFRQGNDAGVRLLCALVPLALRVKRTVKFWEKKDPKSAANLGVARAALDGAARLAVAAEALRELQAEGFADRVGIWLANSPAYESDQLRDSTAPEMHRTSASGAPYEADTPLEPPWRGVVWDRENPSTPVEWEHLAGEAPFPPDLLLGGRAVAEELDGTQILIGVLIELRKVLWVPIVSRGGLQGVILCGTREKHRALPRALPLRLAAELALLLAWEDERSVARERHADIALARSVHRELDAGEVAERRVASPGPPEPRAPHHAEAALTQIVDSIVDPASGALGIGAAFATIAVLPSGWLPEVSAEPLDFRWQSGDADWLQLVKSASLSATLQQSLRDRRTLGIPPPPSWLQVGLSRTSVSRPAVARIVAVPVEAEGKLCGLLLAGLLHRGASLAALERLEYRAHLAGQVLARCNRERRAVLAAQRQRAQLAASRASLLVLDAQGRLTDYSAAAEVLLRETAPEATLAAHQATRPAIAPESPPAISAAEKFFSAGSAACAALSKDLPGPLFPELFKEKDRRSVSHWLQHGATLLSSSGPGAPWPSAHHPSGAAPAMDDVLRAELCNGVAVRLRRELPGARGEDVVALEKIAPAENLAERADGDLALEGVIEWLEEGVVLFDTQDRVRARNTRFEQFAGLAPAESAKGATLEHLISRMATQAAEPAKFAERWRSLARGLAGGVRDELRMTQPTARILERAVRPVLDAQGRHLGRVEVYRDLTAQRVFQSQLLQTEKLAALGQMVSGVAHELSNPLTSILGYAQRLLLREDGAGHLPEVRQIFQEAERASGILRQLLFSARQTPPERRRVALNQVVLRSMELQRLSMAAEKIHMELDLDPALPAVVGDAAQLQQVLMNLVGNARQALEQKDQGGRIRVRTKQTAEHRVQLEVEDDGPGVPQSILARIFDPFFTTKAEGVGTGLGLSIVLSIVREHGGRVDVRNAPEGGAIFSIELPMAERLANAPAWPAGSFELPLNAGAAAKDDAFALMAENHLLAKLRAPALGRVLVVEDEPTVARLIADVLQDEGLTVEVLLDGREGLKRAAERRFDLVICDMRMPGVDGQQFYQSLVHSGNELQHNFLFVTGDVIAPATQAFLERNHLPHLAKPFRVEELTERVRGVLDERRGALAALQRSAGGPMPWKNAAGKA